MKEFYDDRLDAADAISTLADGLNGKAFIEGDVWSPITREGDLMKV